MALILAILNFLASQIGTILGLTQQLQSNTAHGAQESTPYRIDIQVQNIANTTTDLTWGLPALHAQLTAISTALATRQSGSSAVILPSTPPTGYGADNNAIADAVWHYLVGGYTQAAGDLMLDAGMLAINLSSVRAHFPSGKTRYFDIRGTWFSTSGADTDRDYPLFPIANILSTDVLNVFLERESGFTGWTANDDGTWQVAQDVSGNDFTILTTITDAEFLVLRDGVAPVSLAGVPPVWPGIANVTLGTPLALADGITVPGPLHGVLLSITSVPYPISYYPFGALKSYVRAGAVIFVDDNGDGEFAQPLAVESGVICPKTMVRASSALVRLPSGVIGTITPWTTP